MVNCKFVLYEGVIDFRYRMLDFGNIPILQAQNTEFSDNGQLEKFEHPKQLNFEAF